MPSAWPYFEYKSYACKEREKREYLLISERGVVIYCNILTLKNKIKEEAE